MASKKTIEQRERLPEEIYIDEALASGRAKRGRIGLKCLGAPGTVFQARAVENMLDLDHAMRFTEDLVKNGPEYDLFPIVVFRKPGTAIYLIADGIHRTHAYKEAKRLDIPAYIIDGDESDALFYCTMCNQLAVKSRLNEDRAKAIEMLLDTDKWWSRSNSMIANHVGCCQATVKRIRERFVRDGKIPTQYMVTENGDRRLREKVSRKANGHASVEERLANLTPSTVLSLNKGKEYTSFKYGIMINRKSYVGFGKTPEQAMTRLKEKIGTFNRIPVSPVMSSGCLYRNLKKFMFKNL